jgi:2-methylfumaryl-CoA isomerase
MVVSALLAAERHRLRTGAGQSVDLTLKDVAAAMLGNLGIIGEVTVNGTDRAKVGNALYGAYGQDFVCADGRRVMIVALTERQWRGLIDVTDTAAELAALAERLGLDFAREGDRWQARHQITAILSPWFNARSLGDFGDALDKAGVTWSEFRSFARAIAEDSDFSLDNPLFADLDQPGIGRYRVPASPLSFSAAPRPPASPAPLLGEHTEEILADVVRLSDGEIARLFDDGVVAGPAAPG